MSSTKAAAEEIQSRLSAFGDAKIRPMMGEYLLYLDGILIGGIYDDQLLLKETEGNLQHELPRVIPYASAKRTMIWLEDLDNTELLTKIIPLTKAELAKKK